ncbi:MAG: hypothetical protein GF398_20130 [Chitinivibrionales bacterium]|nr:hypothetical protein [Chitinivibrionales bacterium]
MQQGNTVWHGADYGLIRYQTENDSWDLILHNAVTALHLDENVLWTGTGSGLYFADLRYLDWQSYTVADGLGVDSIVDVVADMDFVFAAGSHDLARMDKLIEQWEPIGEFGDTRIYDLFSDQQFLWIATGKGVRRFDKQYEKWETFDTRQGIASTAIYRLFQFGGQLWLLGDEGYAQFNRSVNTWTSSGIDQGILSRQVSGLEVDASNIWSLTPQGIARYSAQSGSWEHFSQNTPIEHAAIFDVSTSGSAIWIAADQGVFLFDEQSRRWTSFSELDGLSSDTQDVIFAIGREALVRRRLAFGVYQADEDAWQTTELIAAAADDASSGRWQGYWDEKGLGAGKPGGPDIALHGRAYVKLKNKAEFPAPVMDNVLDYLRSENLDSTATVLDSFAVSPANDTIRYTHEEQVPRLDDFLYAWTKAQLNLAADLKNGRRLRSSFDNTDPLGDVRYGIEYQGAAEDHIRQAGWQETQKTDYFFSSLIDRTYLEGAGLRAQFGGKIGTKKRRRANLGIWGGRRKTEYLRTLLPFAESNFYELGVRNIISESVAIRVDGELLDPREYSIERTKGLLSFADEGLVNPDSRIEISLEYEPSLSGHTAEALAAENVVVLNDHLAIGANGLYRGKNEPDITGMATDTNRLFTAAVSSEVEYKSGDGDWLFRATPEIAASYNDSILYRKQGSAARIDVQSVLKNLRIAAQADYLTPDFESVADLSSLYGRLKHQLGGEAVYDLTKSIQAGIGAATVRAHAGREDNVEGELLFSFAAAPSIRISTLRQWYAELNADTAADSSRTKRWNQRIEMNWNAPQQLVNALRINRLRVDASYSSDLIEDSLFISDSSGNRTVAHRKRWSNNLFTQLQFAPLRALLFDTKLIARSFYLLSTGSQSWSSAGTRYRPQFTLFSQEMVPGITLYGRYDLDLGRDTVGESQGRQLNSSILLIPGVWLAPLNPLQLNLIYNFNSADSVMSSNDSLIDDASGFTFAVNPTLDIGRDLRISNRSDVSTEYYFDKRTSEAIALSNQIDWSVRDRKTKLTFEYDYLDRTQWLLSTPDTSLTEQVHTLRNRWTERWLPQLRTELQVNFGWEVTDTTIFDSPGAPLRRLANAANFDPALLIDWRTASRIEEFRIQWQTGPVLSGAQSLDFATYAITWNNKLDISLKITQNVFLRLLLNLNYNFDERLLSYDLAELKGTALF